MDKDFEVHEETVEEKFTHLKTPAAMWLVMYSRKFYIQLILSSAVLNNFILLECNLIQFEKYQSSSSNYFF